MEKQQSIFAKAKLHPKSKIGHTIAVLSGKGGVGKSLTSSLIAIHLAKKGYRVGLLDADILGPSIAHLFNVQGQASGQEDYIFPMVSSLEIQIMSASLLLDNIEDPIIWRGALVNDMVRQFYSDVWWHELDYLIIDMPPGTGDVALTIFQKIPVDAMFIVTTPQQLVNTIVAKAIKMAQMLKINILGVIENMAYFVCPDTHKKHYLFGESDTKRIIEKYQIPLHVAIPIISDINTLIASGNLETLSLAEFDPIIESILHLSS